MMGLFGGDTTVSNADRALQTDPQNTAQLAPVFNFQQPIGGNYRSDDRVNLDVRAGDQSPVQVVNNIGLTESWALGYQELIREQQRDQIAILQSQQADAQALMEAIAAASIAFQPTGDTSGSGGGGYLVLPAGDGGGSAGDAPTEPAPASEVPMEVLLLGITVVSLLMG